MVSSSQWPLNAEPVILHIRAEAARKTFYHQEIKINKKLPTKLKNETSILSAIKVIKGNRHSVQLEKVSSIRNKMCALEVFKTLNGVSPHTFQNHFTRVNHSQCPRANAKNIVLPEVKSEAGKKAFSIQGAKVFNKLTDEMKTESPIIRFKNLCKNFNIYV